MNPSAPIKALWQWQRSSLANAFALRAAFIAIACSLMVAMVSLGVIYWVERASLQEKLQEKSSRIADRVEGAIGILENAVTDLSKNPLLVTALLDSPGLASHVVPFLQSYRLPIAAASGLSLCDLNGENLAGMRSELSECRANSPYFKQLIDEGKPQRELRVRKNGHLVWTLYQGVIFPYTGTVEGVVVSQLDLTDLLHSLPKDLDLEGVALQRADTLEILVSTETPDTPTTTVETAKARLFKDSIVGSPFPIEAVARDHISPFQNKLAPLLVGYALGSVVLIMAVVFWARRATRKVVAPLRQLRNVARNIAENGDLTITIPHSGNDEVGQLASALGIMVNTLRASESSLESKVAQRTEQLRKSEAAAEAANLAKSRFLATMSHEIRTPMNGILGMAQLLLMQDQSESERQDYTRTILTSGQTLLTLLNDILDLSKIEAGKLQLETSVFDPEQLIHETQTLFSGSARNKNLQLEAKWLGASRQRYRSDAQHLRQMLSNLVGNAIKFTAQGKICIEGSEIERNGDTAILEFSVSDTGIGIPAEKLDLLFLPFSQADSSTTREFGGSGLGLSIVRSLAKLIGGDVGVESKPGLGSRFWFRIPARIAPVGEDSRQAERPLRQDGKPAIKGSRLSGHVLVAEDNLINRKVIEALLNRLGLTILLANDGQQAVDAITRGATPDAILMDIHMPVMDGYTATEQIRHWESENGRPRLPIIALTADAFEDDRQHCLAVGMDDFLTKPVAVNVLEATLSKWLPRPLEQLPQTLPTAVGNPQETDKIVALVSEIMPLLAQNKFDAIGRFKELQELVAGTDVATEIAEIESPLNAFCFDLAFNRLRQIAADQGWKVIA